MNRHRDPTPAPGQDPDHGLARPFLAAPPPPAEASQPEVAAETTTGQARPYLITGGRTGPGRIKIGIETSVVISDLALAHAAADRATFERARILRRCQQPCSVAELAAHLRLALVVTQVLVGDLVEDGLLEATTIGTEQADDVELLERLIRGVHAL